MKHIGKHIVDVLARFKHAIYLDSVPLAGSDPDKFLCLGSANRINYRTGEQLAADIGALTNDRVSFLFQGYGTSDGTNFEMQEIISDNQAPFEHNTSRGSDGLTAGDPRDFMKSGGKVMTRSGTCKSWVGWSSTAGTTGTTSVGLFKVTPARNSTSQLTPVLLKTTTYTPLGNTKLEDFSENEFAAGFAAGDILYTAVKCSVSSKAWWLNSTLEIEYS